MRALVILLPFVALSCSRSELPLAPGTQAQFPDGSCVASFQRIEPPALLDCTFKGQQGTPLLAAIVGSTLFMVSSNGEARSLFEFVQNPAFADYSIGDTAILSRGLLIAAAVVHTGATFASAAFERVIVRLDGTVVFPSS
jgi:hypothetical protein